MTTITTQTSDQLDRPQWLNSKQWPFTLRSHIHRNGQDEPINIHYTDEGVGPTLVFVHAGMWSFIWRDVIAGLRSNFRCITLDFPGTGLSGGTRHDIDINTYPQIVDAVLDHCGVDKAAFVVHDLGGVVGVLAAALHPHRVTGLVATNSFSWAPDQLALRAMLKVMGSRTVTASLGTLRLIPRMTRSKMGVGRHFDSADRNAFFGPYRNRANSRNFHRTMRSASQATAVFKQAEAALKGPLRHLPVLTVFGEKNDQFGFAKRWKTLFPRATQWTVDGGNHFPMCDDPQGFTKQLITWHQVEVSNKDSYS